MASLNQLIHEIHRRSLWQVLLIYGGASWLVFEIVQTLTEGLGLPEWFPAFALVLLLIGLPIVLATAFVQEGARAGARIDPTLLPTGETEDAQRFETTARSAGATRLLTWRNALLGGTVALALWGAVAAVWLVTVGPPERALSDDVVAVSASAVAVLPFSYQGSSEYAYLGEGIVDLLSTKLDGAGELRSVDPRAVLNFVGDEAAGLDPSRGRRVAQSLAAGLFVLGSIVEVGGRLTLSAALYDWGAGLDPVGEADAEANAEDVFEAVDDLAAELLAGLGTGPSARVRQIAAVTTSSLPALKAYLDGESAYRLGQYQSSLEHLQRAVALDTAYALAYYRLSHMAEYVTQARLAQDAAEQAVRHAGRLAERDRRMLDAFLAWRNGEHGEAERLYRSLVGSYPDELEAWFEFAEVLFHSNPYHSRSFAEAIEPFERVLFYDPENHAAMYHLARIAAAEGRYADMDSLIGRHNELIQSGDRELEMLALQAFAKADADQEDAVVSRMRRTSDVILALAAWDVATWTENIDGAIRVASLLAEPARSVEVRTLGYSWLAHMRLARGQVEAAHGELTQMASLNPVSALEYRALFTAFPFVSTDRTELLDIRDQLEALDAMSVPRSGNPSTFFSGHDDIHPMLREYLLGIVNVQLGEYDRAEAHAAALDAMGRPARTGTMVPDFATSIRAQALHHRGRSGEALATLERTKREIWYNIALASTFWAQTLERFLLAELLFERGRYDEAAAWFANISQIAPFEVAYRPLAFMRLGEIHELQGDVEKAAEYYGKFVDLWSDADPELQPVVEAARRSLTALSPDRS